MATERTPRAPRILRFDPTDNLAVAETAFLASDYASAAAPGAKPAAPLYVVHVQPGHERTMAERLAALAGRDLVRESFMLRYQMLKKLQGAWRLVTENMLPGYVFIASRDPESVQKRLSLSTSFARLLGADKRVLPLQPGEAAFVREFGGSGHVVGFSRGVIEDGRTIVTEGPLAGRADLIRKIDRHKRVAYLDVGLLDQRQVKVGLEIVRKT